MPKQFLRLVAALLTFCLLADPSLAMGPSNQQSIAGQNATFNSTFQEQAVNAALTCFFGRMSETLAKRFTFRLENAREASTTSGTTYTLEKPPAKSSASMLYPDFKSIRNPSIEPIWGKDGNIWTQDLPYLVDLHAKAISQARQQAQETARIEGRDRGWVRDQVSENVTDPFQVFFARAVLNGARKSAPISNLDFGIMERALQDDTAGLSRYLRLLTDRALVGDKAALAILNEYGEFQRFIFEATLEAELYMMSLWTHHYPEPWTWDATHTFSLPFKTYSWGWQSALKDSDLAWQARLFREGVVADSLAKTIGTIWGSYRREDVKGATENLDFLRSKYPYYGGLLMRQLGAMVEDGDTRASQILNQLPAETPDRDRFDGPLLMLPRADSIIANQAPTARAREVGRQFIDRPEGPSKGPGGSGLSPKTLMIAVGTLLAGFAVEMRGVIATATIARIRKFALVVPLFILLAHGVTASAQSMLNIGVTTSVYNPTLIGITANRPIQFLTLGVTWTHRGKHIDISYAPQLMPLFLMSEPHQDLFFGYYGTWTPFNQGGTKFGVGAKPLRFQFSFFPKRRFRPYFELSAGFVETKESIPYQLPANLPQVYPHFNYDLSVGAGITKQFSNGKELKIGAGYGHDSDGRWKGPLGGYDPGIDSVRISVGISFPIKRGFLKHKDRQIKTFPATVRRAA